LELFVLLLALLALFRLSFPCGNPDLEPTGV